MVTAIAQLTIRKTNLILSTANSQTTAKPMYKQKKYKLSKKQHSGNKSVHVQKRSKNKFNY